MPGGVYFKQPQHISTGMLLFDAFYGSQGPEFGTLQPLLVHQEFFFFSLMLAMGPRVLNSAPCSPCWYTRNYFF